MKGKLGIDGQWKVTCRDKDGNVKWVDYIGNLVVDAGVNYALDAALSGGTPITTWYIGLTGGSPSVAAGDTMSSHSWTEVHSDYSESVRQTWTDGGVSSKSVSNTASPATFTFTGTVTVGGAFLTSDSTKNGTSGTLYAVGAFTQGNKAMANTDTLDVTATFTGDDA